jgi:hypothetical protein
MNCDGCGEWMDSGEVYRGPSGGNFHVECLAEAIHQSEQGMASAMFAYFNR